MQLEIRMANLEDAAEILKIYELYILNTAVSFEYVIPGLEEYKMRMEGIMSVYPFLVAESEGQIIGYAYGDQHMSRAAYQWNAELSVYLAEGAKGKGVGTALYDKLISIMQLQHLQTLYACIAFPNRESIGFHESVGFHIVGHFPKSGYKLGVWHDIVWMERKIGDCDVPPDTMLPINEISNDELNKILGEK